MRELLYLLFGIGAKEYRAHPMTLRVRARIVRIIMDEAADDAVLYLFEKWRAAGESPAERVIHFARLQAFKEGRRHAA